jgi:hypothetical protein
MTGTDRENTTDEQSERWRQSTSAGPPEGAESDASQGQVLGRTVEINRAAAEAAPGSPATGARYDDDGNAIA